MTRDPGQIVHDHTVRSPLRRRFGDGLPEPGTAEYDELDPVDQVRLGELRAGLCRPGIEGGPAAARTAGATYDYETPEQRTVNG